MFWNPDQSARWTNPESTLVGCCPMHMLYVFRVVGKHTTPKNLRVKLKLKPNRSQGNQEENLRSLMFPKK